MGERRQDESTQTPDSQTPISSRLCYFPVVKITNSWHPECEEQNMCYLWHFCLLLSSLTTPIHLSKEQGGSFLESDLCWRAGRWQQPQTSPVLLLDHVSLKSLEDLCAGYPKSPPESGSLAAQSPAEGTRVWHRPGKDHSSSLGQSDGQICTA